MPHRFTQTLCTMGLLSILAFSSSAFGQQPGSAPGSNVTTESFQDWEVRCQDSQGPARCAMVQMVTQPGGDQPLMQVVLEHPPANRRTRHELLRATGGFAWQRACS